MGIVAAVVLHAGAGARLERLGVRHFPRRDEIAAANFGALEPELACQPVHQPLHGEGGLRIAGAAHRRHRGLVGGGDRDLHRQRGKHIGPAHHRRRVVGNVDVLQRVSAEIVQQAAADAQQPRLRIDRDVDGPILIALLRGVGEMLTPVLDPFDRALEEPGGRDDGNVFGIDAELGAEPAADVRGRHPQPALVEPHERGQRLEQVMRFLRRGPYRHAVIGGTPLRKNSAALDRMPRTAMLPKLFVHDMRSLAESRLRIAIGDLVGRDDVGIELAANRRRTGIGRLAAVGDGRKHIVIDSNQRRGVLGDIAVVGNDDGDRLADIRYFTVGESERPEPLERRA